MNKIRKMLTASGGPINYKRWDDAKITSYTIPFIKEKAIKLTNAGRATGAVLSTNLLDSLADNAIRAGVPIRTAIGISTKESTLGNPTDDRSAWNISSKIRKLFNGVYPGTVQHINNGTNLVNGINLINYHKGNIDHEMFNGAQGKSIIQEGLEFYKTHPSKYNPGLKGYQKAVDNRGKEVMNSPEVLKWYKEWERSKAQIFRPEPYKINTNIQNTTQEFVSRNKQGGKMNILEFLKNGSGIHIKPENRGKFTKYCHGKVTSECIARGKRSSNPAVRKRATFADNARRWSKHQLGGLIKALLGTKFMDWIKNIVQAGAINENPSVMTASGWRYNSNGKVKQDTQNKAARELDNIFEENSLKKYLDNFMSYGIPTITIGGTNYVGATNTSKNK